MRRRLLTELQKAALQRALDAHARKEWIIATGHGNRVTLASLHTNGLLERRARRGKEGHPDAAYEYRPSQFLLDGLARRRK